MSRFRLSALLIVFFLTFAQVSRAVAQHSMGTHESMSAEEMTNSPCANGAWQRRIDPLSDDQVRGVHHFVSDNHEVQRYFDQGLLFYYAFDALSAMQSFHMATNLDKNLAMGYWGVALAAGGDLNIPIDDPCLKVAVDQARLASDHVVNGSLSQGLYVEAISARYGVGKNGRPRHLDLPRFGEDYVQAMETAWQQLFVTNKDKDPDAAALYAVALMNLDPWRWWTKDGKQTPAITQALKALNGGLQGGFPNHLGLNHFRVHAMEEAPVDQAVAALPSADVLFNSSLEMFPHLRHMPAHIYLLNGNWDKVVQANRNAVAADQYWVDHCTPPTGPECNQQLVGHYRSHDLLFLTVGLSNSGDWEQVRQTAEETEANAARFVDGESGIEHYLTTRVMMATRFAQWGYILSLPAPQENMPSPPREGDLTNEPHFCRELKRPLATALYYFGQTMALSATRASKDKIDESLFRYERAEDCARNGVGWGNNTASDILAVVHLRLDARLAQSEGKAEESASLARLAVEKEDALNYDEPPGWYISSRESYGAALYRWAITMPSGATRTKTFQRALDTFNQDLKLHRNSSRSLFGRWKCYEALRKPAKEVEDAKREFREQWKSSELPSMDIL